MANNKKILLIEDDRMLVDMYKTKFGKEGLELLVASDGAKGLEMVKSEKPDLILLDIILPQIDGFGVLKELKADAGTKKIPVILLTNLGQEEDIKKGEKLGADDYFVKANHTPSEIAGKVKSILKIS